MKVEFPFKVLPRVMTKIIIYYLIKKRYGGFSTYPDNMYETKAGVKLNNMVGTTHCEFKQVQRGRRRKQQCCIVNVVQLQSVSWILAEFYFSRGLQRLYTGTCIILQKTINGFLCLLIVFLKSKTY